MAGLLRVNYQCILSASKVNPTPPPSHTPSILIYLWVDCVGFKGGGWWRVSSWTSCSLPKKREKEKIFSMQLASVVVDYKYQSLKRSNKIITKNTMKGTKYSLLKNSQFPVHSFEFCLEKFYEMFLPFLAVTSGGYTRIYFLK